MAAKSSTKHRQWNVQEYLYEQHNQLRVSELQIQNSGYPVFQDNCLCEESQVALEKFATFNSFMGISFSNADYWKWMKQLSY